MANQIRLKRASGSDPGASDLVTGELAVRTDTAKLFTKKDDNSVAEIGVTDLVDDTSPQLGGDLQTNGNNISFSDDDELRFGAGNDLILEHNGTRNIIKTMNGDINIRYSAQEMIVAKPSGGVELYYQNSKKIDTTNTGIEVHGKIIGDEISIETASSGSQKTLKLNNTNASAGTNEITFSSTTSGTNFEAASIRNGVPNTGNGSLQFKTNNGSGLQSAVVINNDQTTDFSAAIDVTGNITVSGTVDGRDVAADGTKLDGIESGATADQSASEIVALIASQTIAPSKATFPDGNSNGVVIGDGSDLKLFHNGSHTYVENVTGNLNLTSTSSINLLTNDTENSVVCNANSSVELYHNNSKCFETSAYGVKVTGGANGNSDSHNGGTVTFDFSSAAYHFVNMNANSTFAAPINALVGHSGTIFLTQDGTGSRTGSFNSAFKFVGGTAPTLSTAANAVDRLDFVCKATDEIHIAVSLDVK